MNKKSCISLSVIILGIVTVCAGCGSNSVNFYMGISKDSGTQLVTKSKVTILQNKEKIVDSKLKFNKNSEDDYDTVYLSFKGNNIKNVTAESENKTILYGDYTTAVNCVDIFHFYYKADDSINYDSNCQFITESKWDNGNFDDIKNVYFNGESLYDMSRTRLDPDSKSMSVSAVYFDEDNLKDENPLVYLNEEKIVNTPVVYVSLIPDATNVDKEDKFSTDAGEPIVLGTAVTSNVNNNNDSFIYRYEKLFYNSQQTSLKCKNSFEYSDLKGETIKVTVNYNDDSKQYYKIVISFDKNGNIVAELND